MSGSLSNYDPVLKIFHDGLPYLNAADLNQAKADTLAAAIAASGSGGGSYTLTGANIIAALGFTPVSATTAPVTSVNGQTGAVTISAGGSSLTVPNSSLIGGNGTALTSVTVGSGLAYSGGTLSVSYSYTLPTASTSVLGGIKVDGTTITVNGSGVASVISAAPTASGSNATTSTQLVGTGNTYYTVTQLIPAVFPGGASSLVTGTGAALTLGTNLSISGTTLNAAGGGSSTFGTRTTVTYSASPALDGTLNFTAFDVTLTGNFAPTLANTSDNYEYTIILQQDSTGNRIVTWPSAWKWAQGVPLVLSTSPNAIDIVSIKMRGTQVLAAGSKAYG